MHSSKITQAQTPEDDNGEIPVDVAASLTPNELYVCKLLIRGFELREIAEIKDRNIETIRGNLKSIFKKLNVNSQIDVCRRCYGDVTDDQLKQVQREYGLTDPNIEALKNSFTASSKDVAKEVGKKLGVHETTVRTHLSICYQFMGVSGLKEAFIETVTRPPVYIPV